MSLRPLYASYANEFDTEPVVQVKRIERLVQPKGAIQTDQNLKSVNDQKRPSTTTRP